MNLSFALLIILFILMVSIGGKRGLKSFFSLFFNFIFLFIMLFLMALNIDPIKVTIFTCVLITFVTLFYINGFNKKTVSAALSVIIVVLLTMFITYKIGNDAKIQGFSIEELEEISYLSVDMHLEFTKIFTCQVLIGLLCAIIDVAISISSAMNELYRNNLSITRSNLVKSGINIGRDVIGTMTNTLLFAFIGGFIPLCIYFTSLNYSIGEILNKKIFCAEVFQILCGGIGIVLIIPITVLITSRLLSINFSSSDSTK